MDSNRLALIRYVASNYRELQGLTDMAFAAVVGSLAGWTLLFGFDWILAIIGVALLAGALMLTHRYYSERFGRVRGRSHETRPQAWWIGLILGVMGGLGAIWDEKHLGSGLPSLFILSFTVVALWRVISDWPFRTHRLIVVGAGVLASMLYVVVDSDARHREWISTSVCLLSIAMFVTGWLDHQLLVRALGDHAATARQEKTDDAVV